MSTTKTTEALLVIAPGCAHCPTLISHLSTLLKEGSITRLEIINIQQFPEIAARFNVRSVPWLKLGDYVLTGSYNLEELRHWLELTGDEDGLQHYIEQQLADGELDKIIAEVKKYPQWLKTIIHLLRRDDTSMQVRLGIDSIMENMAGTEALRSQADTLGKLAENVHPARLADVIYYLGLCKTDKAATYIKPYLQHANPDIVEASQDALEEIRARP